MRSTQAGDDLTCRRSRGARFATDWIIADILVFAGMEAGREKVHPREFPVRELVDEIVAIAEPVVREKGLDFQLDVPSPDATLVSDPDKLRQITLNLLTNAAKFTERGSVGLRVEAQKDALVITVSDTGAGFPPEQREAIFEPFRQAERPLIRQAGGTGLGLSVSRGLAEMLRGTITAESDPGFGSTFAVRVPTRIES
jgi:signal transduction histidine kinase